MMEKPALLSLLEKTTRSSVIAGLTLSSLLISSTLSHAAGNSNNKPVSANTDAPWSVLTSPKNGRETETSGYDFKELKEPGRTWQRPNSTQWISGFSLTGGGETLKNITIRNFNDRQNLRDDEITDVKIKSGELFYLYTGALVAIPGVAFRTQITIGYHADLIRASNGDITFSRIPLDIIPTWEFEKHRMGLGITYIFRPKLSVDNITGLDDVNYSETIGTLIHYQYKINQNFSVGARYTEVKFNPVGDASISTNGSHLGLSVEFTL